MNASKFVILSLLALILPVANGLSAEAPLVRPAPDKQHAIVISEDRFTFVIQNADGKTLLSSRNIPELQTVTEFNPDHVVWSPSSQAVAVAGGDPRFLLTYVFIRQGNTFVYAPMPMLAQGYDNPWIVPTKWSDKATLVLNISGPHAGKAIDGGYHGEAKIKTSVPKCETVSEKITARE